MGQGQRNDRYILGAVLGAFGLVLIAFGIYWLNVGAAPNAASDPTASPRAQGDVLNEKTTRMQAPSRSDGPAGERRPQQ